MTTGETFSTVFASSVVQKYSDNVALAQAGQTKYTYKQLDGSAKKIALFLQKSGLGTESVVGIALPKSADYVATILGVWYAGAAFVPLDPTLPAERMEFMCAQASVKKIINQREFDHIRACPLSETDRELAKTFRPVPLQDSNLAYIIFTSGSTGRPKGVMVEHKGILNCLLAQIEAFKLDHKSQSLWYLSSNFDASVSDLGTALLSGATLHIEPPETLQPGHGLEQVLTARAITYVDIPPSILRLMDPDKLPQTLKTIVIGGEACAPDVVRAFAAKARLINVYGPTEATICSSLGRCDTKWDRPLIGQPLPGIKYDILDENLNPVPGGIAGELYISGIGLARGYAGRDDLTSAKFIDRQGQRLYKTGDLIIQCPDNEYQFLGRTDRQFKLRGMLIEPEEIETQLMQHRGITRAAVLKRTVKESSARELLIAFISGEEPGDTAALRRHLGETLPKWMVPQRFEYIETMPLTVTGKIDLGKLKTQPLTDLTDWASSKNTEIGACQGHQDPVCRLLSEIWGGVLGVAYPGDEEDFFDLGGDSFAVVEVVVAAEARGLSIPPALILKYPTIGKLAAALKQNQIDGREQEMMTAEQLRVDIALEADFITGKFEGKLAKKLEKDAPAAPSNVLLTGATGFLGSRLLHILCRETKADIYCLVRAKSQNQAEARVLEALTAQGLSISACRDRVVFLCGDLQMPYFGLSEARYQDLADSIDTIFHSGAKVNMLLSYQDLRPANVTGTAQIVRFMQTGFKPKVLHYASTLSVFVATDQNHGLLRESDHLQKTKEIYGGYAQSKWAAEALLRDLDGKAGPVTYHRLGLITGDSQTGLASIHDFLELFVRGIVALGCIPPIDQSLSLDITPVDFAAAAFCRLALESMRRKSFSTYHIANRESLTLERLLSNLHAFGKAVTVVTPEHFRQKLVERGSTLSAAESAACLALCRSLGGATSFASFRTMDLFQATGVVFDQENTRKTLAGSGIDCPPPSNQLVQTYLGKIFS